MEDVRFIWMINAVLETGSRKSCVNVKQQLF